MKKKITKNKIPLVVFEPIIDDFEQQLVLNMIDVSDKVIQMFKGARYPILTISFTLEQIRKKKLSPVEYGEFDRVCHHYFNIATADRAILQTIRKKIHLPGMRREVLLKKFKQELNIVPIASP